MFDGVAAAPAHAEYFDYRVLSVSIHEFKHRISPRIQQQ
jgi:oligoribonuclease (3'-5' exoribonuclease)